MNAPPADFAATLYAPAAGEQPAFQALPQIDTGTHHGPIVQLLALAGGRQLASAGETTIRIWDTASRRLDRLLLGAVAGSTDGDAAGGGVLRIAASPDGRWLVALKHWQHAALVELEPGKPAPGHDGGMTTEVQVFECITGNLQARFVHPGVLCDLDISADGRWLAWAGNQRLRGGLRQVQVSILALPSVLHAGFETPPPVLATLALGPRQRSELAPTAVRFVPGRPARGGAATSWALVAASTDFEARSGQLDWLAFTPGAGLRCTRTLATGCAVVPLSLAVSTTTAAISAVRRSRRSMTGRVLWFEHQPGAGYRADQGEFQTESPAAALAFSPNGTHLLAGLSAENPELGAAGDQTVQVNAYAARAEGGFALRSSYYGHDHTVGALAFTDKDTAVSAGGDNHAIHFWHFAHRVAEPLPAIRGVGRTVYAPGITLDERLLFGTLPERLRPPGHALRQQRFDLRRRELSTTSASEWRMDDFESPKWFIRDRAEQIIPLRHSPDAYGDALDLPPDLQLFVGADDEWVLWSRAGFFDASPNGAQRIGYRISRGSDKEALFIPADRFKAFYRHDLIAAIVKHGSQERAAAHGVVFPAVDVTGILPPIVELAARGIQVRGSELRLRFSVESPCAAYPVTRIWILRNDRFVWVEPKPGKRRRFTVTLPLRPGPNRFSIRAESNMSRAVAVDHEVIGPELPAAERAAATLQPGHLFMLCVGVSDFAAADTPAAAGHRRLRFAHRDAIAVFEAFGGARQGAQAHPNRAFEDVEGALLTDAQANKADILRELDALCTRIRERGRDDAAERDVLFVFLSGHGVRIDGEPDLYFWCHDLNAESAEMLEETGLSMLDLGDRITSVPAEVVLVVDACHAGLAGGNVLRGLDAEELARRIHAVNERGMYILNASRGAEKARENKADRLGVFTSAMLAALRSERFLTRAGGRLSLAMMSLMAGVQQLVPQFSARAGAAAQTPVCRAYGDLLPLTIHETGTVNRRRVAGAAALPRPSTSHNVPVEGTTLANRRRQRMVTAKKAPAKKAPAKKAPAKQAAAKKAPAKKPAPVKTAAKTQAPSDDKGGVTIGRQAPVNSRK